MTAITVEHLSKVYHLYDSPQARLKEALHPLRRKYHHDFYALNDVSFSVEQGEVLGIIGKNGCGKSTLLKILAGVLTPTSGAVTVNGNISALLELGGGFNPEFTGLENVYFSSAIMGYTREQVEKNLDNIITFADIGEFIQQPVKMYSSGMYVRLAFAVAINVDPDVLIIDEALAVGDMNFQAKCMTAITRIQEKGATILFVSHDVGSVKSLCSRAVYLEQGRVKLIGKAGDVVERYVQAMRREMNAEQRKFLRVSNEIPGIQKETSNSANTPQTNADPASTMAVFKEDAEFERRVSLFRYGSGEARITCVELLNLDDVPITMVDFDQKVKIRIYVSALQHEQISVNYTILDEKKINILQSGFSICGKEIMPVYPGERYLIEYQVKLPLQEGDYSIRAHISSPIIRDETAKFIDVVENAVVFKMQRRPFARIWSKVYFHHDLSISKFA